MHRALGKGMAGAQYLPMDHIEFLQGLQPEELEQLTQSDNRTGLWHLAGHLAVILGCGIWIWLAAPLWQVVLVAQGIAICFLFTLVHETTHRTPFRTPQLNDVVGWLAGLPILLPLLWFRYFHLAHHRFTNQPGKDPELLAGGHPRTWGQLIWHVSGLPYWIGMIRQILANAFGGDVGDYVPAKAIGKVRREARLFLLAYLLAASAIVAVPALFWVWVLPVLLGQPFLRLYLLAEHGRCAPVANMFENTRTTYTAALVRFLAWNMPYHVEHHSLPRVPFHRLPALNRRMADHLRVTAPGYGAFTRDYVEGLREEGEG